MRYIGISIIFFLLFSACSKPSKSGLVLSDSSMFDEAKNGKFEEIPDEELNSLPTDKLPSSKESDTPPLQSGLNSTLNSMQGAANAYANNGMNSASTRGQLFAAFCNSNDIASATSAYRGFRLGGGLSRVGSMMSKSRQRMGKLIGSAVKGGGGASSMLMSALSSLGQTEEEPQPEENSFDELLAQMIQSYSQKPQPSPTPSPAATQYNAKLEALCAQLKSTPSGYNYAQIGQMLPPPYQTMSVNAAGTQLYDTYQGVRYMTRKLYYR